jgi:hypothetical protein
MYLRNLDDATGRRRGISTGRYGRTSRIHTDEYWKLGRRLGHSLRLQLGYNIADFRILTVCYCIGRDTIENVDWLLRKGQTDFGGGGSSR